MSINNVAGVRSDINEMLSKMRELSNKSRVFSGENSDSTNQILQVGHSTEANFDHVLSMAKNSLSIVSDAQMQSETLKNSYISGDSNVSMAQVVLASQKSKLAFEGLVTVRNKLLEAYKEIMNMPV